MEFRILTKERRAPKMVNTVNGKNTLTLTLVGKCERSFSLSFLHFFQGQLIAVGRSSLPWAMNIHACARLQGLSVF